MIEEKKYYLYKCDKCEEEVGTGIEPKDMYKKLKWAIDESTGKCYCKSCAWRYYEGVIDGLKKREVKKQ